ncbi:hypothetical protein WR25_14388 [Diploscapter pachys]|uniref:Zinc metalloproteinase n=1 Tax=Diploscapter pachys TaxID=2018661 RepID=A0A2A2LI43_9BILA|nr:hypothetical protein WR25_14388 [Diploscapter pachys]
MRVRGALALFLCSYFLSVAQGQILSDVVNDYAEVKQLLTNYYRRAARRMGNDYAPENPASPPPADERTEAGVNYQIWEEVFENDIILTLPQAEALLDEGNSRSKRQIHPNSQLFWTNTTISYEFTNTNSDREKWAEDIRTGLRHVESVTCIRFKENGTDKNRLRYFRGQGCWSNVGMIGGRQWVSIGYGCESMGIVAHETLHALGLWHEQFENVHLQSRNDRDDHIDIDFSYIMRGTEGNFEKRDGRSSENLGQPYDISSVMHYGSRAFSRDWTSYTIRAHDPLYQRSMGQREGLSFKDAKMLNIRYCSNVCSKELPCQNNGYTDPNRCDICRCPKGYGGAFCERSTYTHCGNDLMATNAEQKLESGEPKPGMFCVWRIIAPAGQKVRLNFDEVNFSCNDPCSSYVEVNAKLDKTTSGGKLCCDYNDTIISEGQDIVLYYKVDINHYPGYHGFRLRYTIDDAPPASTTTPLPIVPTVIGTRVTTESPIDTSTNPEELTTTTDFETTTDEAQTELTTATTTPETTTEPIESFADGVHAPNRVEAVAFVGARENVMEETDGEKTGEEYCNTEVCPTGQRSIVCDGRVILPCDMLDRLDFGQKEGDLAYPGVTVAPSVKSVIPSALSNYIVRPHPTKRKTLILFPMRSDQYAKVSRSKRFANDAQSQNVKMCEKKFRYQCPTALLTVHLHWKTALSSNDQNQLDQRQSPLCCEGFYAHQGKCYKRN